MNNNANGAGNQVPAISVQEAWDRLKSDTQADGPVLIDVRETWEYQRGHAQGAQHIPLGEVMGQLDQIPRDRDVLLICQSGYRSENAARALMNAGYTRVYNVIGGTSDWRSHHLPLD